MPSLLNLAVGSEEASTGKSESAMTEVMTEPQPFPVREKASSIRGELKMLGPRRV
jgi:hypothetical protein